MIYESICLYSVDVSDYGNPQKVKTCYGFLFANNFTNAVEQLEKTLYGEDLVKINNIELFDSIPEISFQTYEQLRKELGSC